MSLTDPTPAITQQPGKRSRFWWNALGASVALVAIVATLGLWINSQEFGNLVRGRIIAEIASATGGRVEMASFRWSLFNLEAEAGGLVIHGNEEPDQAPYAKVERLTVRLSVLGLWSPRILLRDLEVVRPRFHVIFYPDGTNNQPHPQKPRQGTSGMDTLFNLRAGHIAVEQGLIDLDNRAASLDFQNRYQPLDFQADDVSVVMRYVAAAGQTPATYHIEAGVRDLNLMRSPVHKDAQQVRGFAQATLDLTRDAAYLRSLRIVVHAAGAPDRTLEVRGGLFNFARPRWQATVTGDLDMRLLDPVLGYNFAPEGIARLDLTTGGDAGEFSIDGTVHARKASYVGTGVVARGVDLTARVHADQGELLITSVVARLQQGGAIEGEVLLHHWLPPVPGRDVMQAPVAHAAPPALSLRKKLWSRLHPQPRVQLPTPAPHSILVKAPEVTIPVDGKVNARFKGVTLDTILDLVSEPPFQRLGINTLIDGPATAVWSHGDVNSLSVDSNLSLDSPGVSVAGETAATGAIDATYTQRDGSVDLRRLQLNLPASELSAHGRLGAYPLTSATALSVDFHSHNLAEFDTVFKSLGLTRNGKSGVAALPVSLAGQADFHGAWDGSLTSPALSGKLQATQVDVEVPVNGGAPRSIRWDSITADGTYDAEKIAIVHGRLVRGTSQITVDGSLTAVTPPVHTTRTAARLQNGLRGDEMPAFDEDSVMHVHVDAARVNAGDLLPLTGMQIPVTGLVDAKLQADGPIHALGGSGWAQLENGVVYGEPVTSIHAQGTFANQIIDLTSVSATGRAGAVTASGTYDLRSHQFRARAQSAGIDIAQIQRLDPSENALQGKLGFAVSATGTMQDPHVEGQAKLAGLTVSDVALGTVDMTAHTEGGALVYEATTGFDSARLSVHGSTRLDGDFPTQAKLDFNGFNIAALFKLAHFESIGAESDLQGTASVSGAMAHPEGLAGDLRLNKFAVVIDGVHLKSDQDIHATLTHGRVSLDPVHITGDNTDLHAEGTLGLRNDRQIDFAASGSVNLKLAQTLDPDLTAGGTSTFQVKAHGPLSKPGLQGSVDFQNGSLSLEDLPNGLSQLRGRLEFSQNRLEVKSLTAMTGGGQLQLGGFLAYQHGIYADLSVNGKNIRIRYPQGVSSLADADLHLQGTQANLLLSGKILITRFSVSPDLDIAALAAQANTVQPVALPNAPSNHIRLDVHIQSSPQLNFQNAYAKLSGEMDLNVRGTVATPSLLGRVTITQGNATVAGTRYELQRGDITFTNPVRIQPNIDLNATARVEDYDITLGLHGTPDKLSVVYRSDPPLPEADVVALLALGRTQSEQGLYTQQQQQSAGLAPSTDVLLGGALNATVSSRVQKLFGAGSVKVDPSYLGALGTSTTRITVEEQLGKNLTLTYATNVDTTAQQLLQAEIAINRHVSLLVTRDESDVFSIVLKATRRYR